mmetsp:Transcript_19098/g.28271  ORF Transcript_19098/g.28271 Transcript_19098/m.28271 type:complete len:139 (+) Transcript_19098:1976-2392(+)
MLSEEPAACSRSKILRLEMMFLVKDLGIIQWWTLISMPSCEKRDETSDPDSGFSFLSENGKSSRSRKDLIERRTVTVFRRRSCRDMKTVARLYDTTARGWYKCYIGDGKSSSNTFIVLALTCDRLLVICGVEQCRSAF